MFVILESSGIEPKCVGGKTRVWVECWDAAFDPKIRGLVQSDRRYRVVDGDGF